MKKHAFTCLVILLFIQNAQAQNISYYNRMNQIFGAIEKDKVTSGLLKDYGVRLNEVEAYNGDCSSPTRLQSLIAFLYLRTKTNL